MSMKKKIASLGLAVSLLASGSISASATTIQESPADAPGGITILNQQKHITATKLYSSKSSIPTTMWYNKGGWYGTLKLYDTDVVSSTEYIAKYEGMVTKAME